jgi:hypothetical protein
VFYALIFASWHLAGCQTRWLGPPSAAWPPKSAHHRLLLTPSCPTQRAGRVVTHPLTSTPCPIHRAIRQFARAHNRKIWRDVQRSRSTLTAENIRRSDFLLGRKEMLLGNRRQGRESVSEYSSSCIGMSADDALISADEHVQTSGPRTWRPPLLGRRGPRRRRSSTLGCSSRTCSHPPPASALPEGAGGLCLGVASSHSGHLRGIGPRISNIEGS